MIVYSNNCSNKELLHSLINLFSYCDENLKCNSWYRAYASNVPEYLRNKPRDLVKHCMLKIEEAKHYDKTGIAISIYKYQYLKVKINFI